MATRCSSFDVTGTLGLARTGTLRLPHGAVPTPCFMPVGTRAAVRAVTVDQVRATGAAMVLANTYHLWERPGHEVVAALGGIHRFMGWSGPILTDSGGFQVFSLRDQVKVTEEGARFTSAVDGTRRSLTPEKAVEIQETLGVDVAMALDECIEFPATRERTLASTQRSTRWLARCVASRRHPERTALFGIVQGGTYHDLRVAHAQELAAMDLDGYAIGGLSVGEGRDALVELAAISAAHLPKDRVRYLMGVGYPRDLVAAVRVGVDLFDCVLPTRSARHAQVFTSVGRLNIKNAVHRLDAGPLDPSCDCTTCAGYSRGYLHHLKRVNENLGDTLITVHNLQYYQGLMRRLRGVIAAGDGGGLDALGDEAERASSRA